MAEIALSSQGKGHTCQCRCPCHNVKTSNSHPGQNSEPATLPVSNSLQVNRPTTKELTIFEEKETSGSYMKLTTKPKKNPTEAPSPLDAAFSRSFLHVKNIVRNMTARWESLKDDERDSSDVTSTQEPNTRIHNAKFAWINVTTRVEDENDQNKTFDRHLYVEPPIRITKSKSFEPTFFQQSNRDRDYALNDIKSRNDSDKDLMQLNKETSAPRQLTEKEVLHEAKKPRNVADGIVANAIKSSEVPSYAFSTLANSAASGKAEDRSKKVIKMKDEKNLPSLHSAKEKNGCQAAKTDKTLALPWYEPPTVKKVDGKSLEESRSVEDSSKTMTGSYHHQSSGIRHSSQINKSSNSAHHSNTDQDGDEESQKRSDIKKVRDSAEQQTLTKRGGITCNPENGPILNERENNYDRSLYPRKQLEKITSKDYLQAQDIFPESNSKADEDPLLVSKTKDAAVVQEPSALGRQKENSNCLTGKGIKKKNVHSENGFYNLNSSNDKTQLDRMVKAAINLTVPSYPPETKCMLVHGLQTNTNQALAEISKDFDEVRATPSTLLIDTIGHAFSVTNAAPKKINLGEISSSRHSDRDVTSKSGYAVICKSRSTSGRDYRPRKEFYICEKCQRIVQSREATFHIEGGSERAWHPNCFRCSTCEESLLDIHHSFLDGNPYCVEHYRFVANIPKCFKCQELILDSKYTSAAGNFWHREHFNCKTCEKPLVDTKYVLDKTEDAFCLRCHEARSPKLCMSCHTKIALLDPYVQGGSLSWHSNNDCLRCARCDRSLVGSPLLYRKGDDLYCNKYCALQEKQYSCY